MTNPERIDEEEIETYKVINNAMVEDIANILTEMEEFFISSGITNGSVSRRERRSIVN